MEVPPEETEEMRIQKAQEAVEQERLRMEVAKLENVIEPEVVMKRQELTQKSQDSDSSNTDISDDEEEGDKRGVEPPPPQQQHVEESEDDRLKKAIMQKILEKKQREEASALQANNKTLHQQQGDVEMKGEHGSGGEQDEEEKVIDMFADSGDEGKEPTAEGDNEKSDIGQIASKEEDKLDIDSGMPIKEEPLDDFEMKPVNETISAVQPEIPKEEILEEEIPKVDTLKSLDELRNRMDQMTSEELEAALKNLPSTNLGKDAEDGRTTPLHLRDIHVPIRSLTEFVSNDKRTLWKQIFRTINKKEFKRMLPKYLRVRVDSYFDACTRG